MRNVKKRALAHLAAAAVVVPLTVVGTSGEAFADGARTWKNAKTGMCLSWGNAPTVETNKYDCSAKYAKWFEEEQSNGSFRMKINQIGVWDQYCLDSSDAGRVYTKPCNSGNYQKWRHTHTSTGWKVTNVATGRVLDSSDGGKVYTKPDNGGKYQRWL
ncbi:RICIN domain-containing protein [Streptomyces albireticuli]|uniref:RICIN domain-containing protein n=1 Tax=Streptomyces albireticuli TaxID=1940 RepID=UPI00117DDDC9|nr:ricin-type beta-trefoil lectin domain protein [Streptomyces albireticuli]MCD9140869.1 RICIN domain-containing protein [Streptomyces albireticuli]MCD9161169.1 RICIN domain-containing protein [Streptomyces albireticuli]MCD9190773.1 RICIN domain-containing protein [Streptomyces albireticuli]